MSDFVTGAPDRVMNRSKAPPILVTGAHRSGSTWVGRTLAQASGVGYIDEPFRIDHRPGVLRTRIPYWFPYIREGLNDTVAHDFQRTLAFRYGALEELRSLRSVHDAGRMARDTFRFANLRVRGARPLVKDPLAVLSAPWLATEFTMQVVVMIRHPAAFASSLKRVGWTHPFSHFLDQPQLMEELLCGYAAQIEAFARRPPDIIDQAVLLWNIIHSVIAGYQRKYADWIFVRHEDLSSEPGVGFRRLADRLGLNYAPAMEAFVAKSTGASNPAEARAGVVHELRRDSAASIRTWRSRLAEDEIDRIRRGTGAVAAAFFSDAEW